MPLKILLLAYAVLNLISFILYGVDKSKARRRAWRIPERVLLGFSFFGGAVGGLFGMNVFHHKTKHWYFWAVNLLGLAAQIALALAVYLLL